jgi:hypothetical protein
MIVSGKTWACKVQGKKKAGDRGAVLLRYGVIDAGNF